ncbi:unnamed protein product [Paramecium sonneborni]|uniref:MORN repeat protein n=1 Tax=Paramecium sonneborni TaxID=65129 RepID=A0A8S1MYH0_9CILI|nr:unnamed protein product [Paramecium sonneborni]
MGIVCCSNQDVGILNIQPMIPLIPTEEASLDEQKIVKIQSSIRRYLAKSKQKQKPGASETTAVQEKSNMSEQIVSIIEMIPKDAQKVDWPLNLLQAVQNKLKELPPLVELAQQCYLLSDGCYYQGPFVNYQKEGFGRQIDMDGSLYEGTFKNNVKQGKGRQISCDGSVYEGNFDDNEYDGYGEFQDSYGFVYKGEWKQSLFNGEGLEINEQFQYKGAYKLGHRTGYGEIIYVDGNKYMGEFQKNRYEGLGIFLYADGRKYEGGWMNNQMHGKGTFFWPDGRKYTGNYHLDQKEGFGEFLFENGSSYRGMWKQGKQHGHGAMISELGDQREGEWVEGRRIKWR